jgi:N-acetylglucosamine-6-phosphate deacetylase
MSAEHEPFILRGRILVDTELREGAVVVEQGHIAAVLDAPAAQASELPDPLAGAPADRIIASGFIDLQLNGAFGADCSEGPEALAHIARELPRTGVTTFLPTLVSTEREAYPAMLAALPCALGPGPSAQSPDGASALGWHLEGPWLTIRRKGAHREEAIEGATFDQLDDLPDTVRLVTLAPDRVGAHEAIRRLVARGITVSLGHTDADYDTFRAAVDAGATLATHLYNAMSPFHHRAPGAVGAALDDPRITATLIADGIHTHPAAARIAIRAKTPARIALVTDAISAVNLGTGQNSTAHTLGHQSVHVDATSARLADGTLAGSVLTMDTAIRNLVAWTAATPAEALRMASATPARALTLTDRGRIAPSLRADLTVLDAYLEVLATFVAGALSHHRDT